MEIKKKSYIFIIFFSVRDSKNFNFQFRNLFILIKTNNSHAIFPVTKHFCAFHSPCKFASKRTLLSRVHQKNEKYGFTFTFSAFIHGLRFPNFLPIRINQKNLYVYFQVIDCRCTHVNVPHIFQAHKL